MKGEKAIRGGRLLREGGPFHLESSKKRLPKQKIDHCHR